MDLLEGKYLFYLLSFLLFVTQIRATIHANNPAAVTRWLAVARAEYDQSSSFSGSWFQFSISHHQASAESSADNPNTHCLMLNIQNIQNISDLWLTGGHMMEERDGEGENICLLPVY